MRSRPFFFCVLCVLCGFETAAAGDETEIRRAIPFAEVDGQTLALDLYLPSLATPPVPLVVWVHGGAWRRGSREKMPLTGLVKKGYAIASVDYRLSPVAPFPTNVHDIKAAIRHCRARAAEYRIDPDRIAVAGASAGGHLAALVGVTNGHPELEGEVGPDKTTSSDVQAAVSFYGASNLETILSQSTPHGLGVRIPALQLLLGGQPGDKKDLARLASPVTHVDDTDPPMLLFHGDRDPQMPINQSHELHGIYKETASTCEFHVLHHAAHGGDAFYDETRLALIDAFLRRAGL